MLATTARTLQTQPPDALPGHTPDAPAEPRTPLHDDALTSPDTARTRTGHAPGGHRTPRQLAARRAIDRAFDLPGDDDPTALTALADRIEDALRTVPVHLGPNALALLHHGHTVPLSGGEYAALALAAAQTLLADPQQPPHLKARP
ncbi:hypothetical protein [Streptomyces sp. SID11385]|uniref:hypothetical protein n=1 Tax=Streptomyces sp. SID11385 TaxID=2706031 RepID=UPI0013C64C53|nr:hypothetical protein [Streptomyces sp. SID11385]NEA42713.1 hypothetical protein [Streptomyces sp. SID11385]